MENKQTAFEWLIFQAVNWARNTNSGNDIIEFPKGAIKQVKEMEKKQAQNYAEFCVMCDRNNLPLLDFESYILTNGGNNDQKK